MTAIEKQVKILKDWAFNLGYKAGTTDGWMFSNKKDVLQRLKEEIEMKHYQKNKSYEALVQYWEEGWEQTDHFVILYSKKFWDKIGELDIEDDYRIEIWQDMRDEWWEGVIEGLAKRKINVYKMASILVKK